MLHQRRSSLVAQGLYVPFPSHSFLAPIGSTAWILMLDCRAERKLEHVCSEEQYAKVFGRLNLLPSRVEHLTIQLVDASPSAIVTASETECLHRDSDCLSPHGVLGERVVVKIQSFRCIREVGY